MQAPSYELIWCWIGLSRENLTEVLEKVGDVCLTFRSFRKLLVDQVLEATISTEWGSSAHDHEHANTNPEDIDCLRIVELTLENFWSSIDLSHLMFILKPDRAVLSHAKVD